MLCCLSEIIGNAIYPNGSWKGKDGDVRIGLHLCGLPPNVSKMSVQWTVHCHEANIKQTSWKSIFCQLRIECPQIQNKMVFPRSYMYNKAIAYGGYISSFEDLKASCDKALTFVITIHMARITLKEDNKILFQMRTNKYKRKTQLQWKIDEEMMKKLKSFDKGKGICSDILNDIWCLKLYPNGSWKGKDGDVRIGLHLCGLPPNVSKMSVQWTVHCHEANIK
eukprot:935872_1